MPASFTAAPTVDPASNPAERRRHRWVLPVVAVAQLMIVLDSSIVNIALPQAQRGLHIATLAEAQWAVTGYALAFGGLLLIGGRVADLFGRKRTFLIGLIGFAVASGIGGTAVDGAMLIAARAVQGGFAALLAPAALSILATTYTAGKERSTAFAVYGGISGGGSAIGLLLGGLLTESVGWRWCLFVNIPIAIVAAVFAVVILRESRVADDARLDVIGALLSSAGLIGLVYGTTLASDASLGWGSLQVIGVLALSVGLLAAFAVWESRARFPLLPPRVPADRNRGAAYVGILLVGLGLFGMFLFLTFYFQQTLGYTPLQAGLGFLPFSVGFLIAAGLAGRLMPRFGAKAMMLAGLPIGAIGLLALCGISAHANFWLNIALPELVISLGMGAAFIALSATALHDVAERDAGVASALQNAAQQVGGALGTAVLSTIYVSAWTAWLADRGLHPVQTAAGPQPTSAASIAGYQLIFVIAAGLLLVAAVIVLLLVRIPRDAAAHTADV